MKCPEQKTRWSLVTRTLKRSLMVDDTGGPGNRRRQLHDTRAQSDEQGSRHQVGRGAGVAAVAFGTEPGVQAAECEAASRRYGPIQGQNFLCTVAGFFCFRQAALARDQA